MVKKAFVIAPHQDDEINLIGTLMDQLHSADICVKVLFVTNGDYPPSDVKQRIKETLRAAKKMKINEVFFLGYGDCPDGLHHIFTQTEGIYHSVSGHSETYCVNGAADYRYKKSGVHSKYQIHSLKNDMKDCILSERPELIFSVDHDSHPDHRMTSIIFDEVIRDICVDSDYRPIVFKKFAYAGTWHGRADYFQNQMQPTVLTEEQYFPYTPDQEVRLSVLPRNYPVWFWKSDVYKWCRTYKSQNAKDHFFSIVNADALCFYRETRNIAFEAEVTVSSGEGKVLNDFKLFDTDVIAGKLVINEELISKYTWIPSVDDKRKQCVFRFKNPVSVKSIAFHQSHDKSSTIKEIRIDLSNEYTDIALIEGKQFYLYTFPQKQENISEIQITVLSYSGSHFGFREIEIFDHLHEIPWNEIPFTSYEPIRIKRKFCTLMQKAFHLRAFLLEDLRMNGFMYYVKRLFAKVSKK